MTNELVSRTEKAFRWIPVGALAVGACSLAWNEYGSVDARDWLPYAVATALLVGGLLLSGAASQPPRVALIGLACLLALAAWDALSLRWSPVPALARDEALLIVFYALVVLVPIVLLRSYSDRHAATAIVVGILGVLAVAALAELLVVAHPKDHYENGRLTFPISYVNAQAALFLVAFWPSVALASERRTRPVLRAAVMGGACAMLAGWLMTQSKGGLVALVAAGTVFFALNPNRLGAVIPTLIPAALIGGSYELLTRPFRDRYTPEFADAIHTAATWALVLVGIGALAGFTYFLAERRVSMRRSQQRLIGIVLLAALAGAIVAALATFFVVVDRPGHYLSEKWDSFKTLPTREQGSSHLTSLGSNRYDFWRVELRLAREHPLAGVGARGFAQRYLAERRSRETPARGHSLELDTLAETGLVGLALLAAAIGLPLARAIARGREATLAAGLAAAGAYGVVHGSGDWVWTFPAFGVPLFLLLGIANSGGTGPARPIRGPLAVAAGAAAVALALGAFALPWISARLSAHALRNPSQASRDLRWARRLDPLSIDPWLAKASLATSAEEAVEALTEAVQKEPDVSGLRYQLGLADLRAGRKAAALRELEMAHRLDPRDAQVARALRRSGG